MVYDGKIKRAAFALDDVDIVKDCDAL